ncbi:MAG: hypothetical protein Q8O97_03040 [bacterium]|nr:hypothetical protein [Candidatus Wildermuthbacteria bacterium]MDP2664901.1 hypothetical protein [bacterium]
MKFELSLEKENLLTILRRVGYAPKLQTGTEEEEYAKSLNGNSYPRFHVYARVMSEERRAFLNLHLDQRQPSYQGTARHGGEYEGAQVEIEAQRIKSSAQG